MGKGWRSLEAPSTGTPADSSTLPGLTVYYEFRDSAGEMHVVDSKELIPKDAKGLHKVYLRNVPTAAPPPVEVPFLRQTESATHSALGAMANQLGVQPPPPPALFTAAPVTAATCLVPSIPVLHRESFSPSIAGPVTVLLAVGLLPPVTRRFCMRILVTGVSMALLGTVYMDWAKAHGYQRVSPAGIVQNAADVANTVNSHNAEQQRVLDAIERDGKVER